MRSVEDAAHAIRRLVPGDAEELTALLAANRAFLAPYVPDQPAGFFRANTQRARIARAEHLYGILDRGALAGTIALTNLVRGEFQSANVGYWVGEARNGRGLATRSLGALVEVAFDGLALHRLEAGTLVDNVASQRVLEHNGFSRIGIASRYLWIAGGWRDHVLFQRTAED